MKILIIKGSPHVNGTTNTIVNEFIKGAQENNIIDIYDAGHGNTHPCLGCDCCHMNGECIQKDDGNKLLAKILESDCLVFVTPVYNFGMSAQLKMVLDRFYARNMMIQRKHLKAIYIAAAWNDDSKVMSALDMHFNILTTYLNFNEIGRIMARGAGYPSMIRQSYLKMAYDLGKNLK